MISRLLKPLVLVAALSLGACAGMPDVRDAIDRATSVSAQDRVHSAMELLQRGEAGRAKSQLQGVLHDEPGNATARRLLEQINTDPRALLGASSRAYVAQEGDTMSGLAEHYLGDPLLFYALARYNNLAPNQLHAGQHLQLPTRNRSTSAAAHRPSTPSTSSATAPSVVSGAPVEPPVAAPAVSADAARANQLRLRGLELLNSGDAGGAVSLLRQAAALDAGNPAIRRDLARAQRIQSSVQTQ